VLQKTASASIFLIPVVFVINRDSPDFRRSDGSVRDSVILVLLTGGGSMRNFVLGVVGLCACSVAQAQYATGFEAPTYNASAAGTLLTNGFGGGGQAGWYNPVAGSVDFKAHTYAGNTLGFPANPNGGSQFVGAVGAAAPSNIGRAQQPVNFGAGGTWTVEWDVIGAFAGGATPPAVDNLGSFSLQNSTVANYFQQIMQWGANTPAPVQYNINYGSWGAAGGTAATIVFQSPGPAWQNIPVNHWIHQSTTWDFGTNQLLSVTIQDITAGSAAVTADVSGLGWYLTGGANNILGMPLPTDIRLFTGNVNNATGWDNVTVVPAPGAIGLLALGGLAAGRRRRR
jgi:MYXO-CTERM domain-containing protein